MEHDFLQDDDLGQQWLDHWSKVEVASQTALHRSSAIKTGIIEGIYQLGEGQIQTLI